MKKTILLFTLILAGMSSLFAWTNIIELGLTGSVPDNITIANKPNDSYKFNSTGLEIGYIGTFDSGFALKATTKSGFGSFADNSINSNKSIEFGPTNFSSTETIGLGYAFVNTDSLYLGLFGNIGDTINYGLAITKDNSSSEAKLIAGNTFFFGGDISTVFTPTKVFSLYASASANVAYGVYTAMSKTSADDDWKYKDFISNPFLKVIPTIGFAWKW